MCILVYLSYFSIYKNSTNGGNSSKTCCMYAHCPIPSTSLKLQLKCGVTYTDSTLHNPHIFFHMKSNLIFKKCLRNRCFTHEGTGRQSNKAPSSRTPCQGQQSWPQTAVCLPGWPQPVPPACWVWVGTVIPLTIGVWGQDALQLCRGGTEGRNHNPEKRSLEERACVSHVTGVPWTTGISYHHLCACAKRELAPW